MPADPSRDSFLYRLYCRLLKLYPAGFREEYGQPLEQQFRDEVRDAASGSQRARLFLRAIADLAVSIPRELASELLRDLRFSLRVYRRRKFSTGLALAALALAIGASTGIFSVVNALLLRSLPFEDPARLVELRSRPLPSFEGPDAFHQAAADSPYLAQAANYAVQEMAMVTSPLGTAGEAASAMRIRVAETTADFFAVLGVEPHIGRAFAAGEDEVGNDQVAVISYGLWQQAFGGDSRVLGSLIRVNGVPLTVIGVAPQGVDFPARSVIWAPTIFDFQRLPKESSWVLNTVGRLKPGIGIQQATVMLQTEVARNYPGGAPDWMSDPENSPRVISLREQLAGPVRQASLVLLGIVALVLLIACANVAQLLLSRATERRQEWAVRGALGASRARLTQQFITEALLLTGTAAVTGLLVANWAAQLADTVMPSPLATQTYTVLDWRVTAFALGLAVVTGFGFGVVPALVIGGEHRLQDGTRSQAGGAGNQASHRARMGLVAVQAALTVLLVGGAITMSRSFVALLEREVWYDTSQTITLSASLAGTAYQSSGTGHQYYQQAVDRLRAIPGVETAGLVNYLPMFGGTYAAGNFELANGARLDLVGLNAVSPGYFPAMGAELIAGRDFTAADYDSPEPALIVSEAFARELGVGKEIVGMQGRLHVGSNDDPPLSTITGLVRTESFQQVYRPLDSPAFATFVARVRGNPAEYLAVARDAIQSIDRDVPVYDVKTLEQRMNQNFAQQRFYALAVAFLAGFALLLAVIGVYGVASYSVTRRTKEIGVRIAVGATPASVRAMLLKQGMLPVAVGLALGLLVLPELGTLLGYVARDLEPIDLETSAASAVALLLAATIAVWKATARVVRIDPMEALRTE